MCDLFFLSASKWLFPLSPPVLFCIVSQPGFSPEIRDWFYTFFQLPYTFFKLLSLIFVVRACPAFSYPLQALWCRKGNHLRKQLCSKTRMKEKNSSKYLRTENQAANLITRSKIIIIIITINFFKWANHLSFGAVDLLIYIIFFFFKWSILNAMQQRNNTKSYRL